MDAPTIRIVDVMRAFDAPNPPDRIQRFLYRCLAPHPYRRYRKRARYLEEAAPRGLRKEILFMGGDPVGEIEYAPAAASAYPISGEGVWVMNCIWVLRRARGHRLGEMLVKRMIETARGASGIATVALEGHQTPWLKLRQMEALGFRSIDSRRMRHKVKRRDLCFRVHLMWMPVEADARPPTMDWEEMLKGVDFCIAHPLYRAERYHLEEIYEAC